MADLMVDEIALIAPQIACEIGHAELPTERVDHDARTDPAGEGTSRVERITQLIDLVG